jgi:O-antigen/teichoic acid export membrane protein
VSQHPAPASRATEGAAMLSIGTVASGVLAYAFNVLAARALGPDDYGPVALLWATVFLVSVVLFRPVEQTLSRGIADRLARGGDPLPVVRAAGRVAGTVAGTAVAVCLLAWTPITDGLFDGHAALTAALIAGIAGYGVSFFARGLMGGLRWFGGYGMLLLADGAVRIALALPLALVASPAIAGIAVAGAAIGGALAPLAGSGRAQARRLRPDGDGEPFPVRNALRFAGPVTVIAAADQLLVSGGPLLVVLAGGPGATAAAGTVFAATMLVRAPVFLFQGFAAALLPSLTALQAVGDAARFRRAVLRAAGALGLFALALTVAALVAGPLGMHILYGPGFEVERLDLAILAAGVGGYLAASAFSQAALARGEAVRAAAIWTLSAVTFIISELAVTGSSLHRVSLAFALAAAVNTVLFAALVLRREPAPREAALALG